MEDLKNKELLTYLTGALRAARDLQFLLQSKNKTKKTKAIISMLKILEMRIDAVERYARSGGYSQLTVEMQSDIYTPILEWLASEIS